MEENCKIEDDINLETETVQDSDEKQPVQDVDIDTSERPDLGRTGTAGHKEKFFKKEKKDKKDLMIEELTDKLKRNMAEFDNFRKRTEKEKSMMYEIGAKDIVEKILPVIDNFERGLGSASQEELSTPFVEGMDKTYKQFVKALEDAGVTPIEALEKEFNPDFHNAVMHVEDENFGENIVIEEFQKGYTYRDSVIRHSMVKVAN